MTAIYLVTPMNQASAQGNMETVQEMAQNLASTIVSDYGVTSLQYAIRDSGSIVLSDSAGVYDNATNAPITKDTMLLSQQNVCDGRSDDAC